MKTLFLVLMLAGMLGCASTSTSTPGVFHTEVISTHQSLSSEQVWDVYRACCSDIFVSSKSVVDYENREAGVIKGNCYIDFDWWLMATPMTSRAYCKFTIEFKENKSRLVMDIISYDWNRTLPSGVTLNQMSLDMLKNHVGNRLQLLTELFESCANTQKSSW